MKIEIFWTKFQYEYGRIDDKNKLKKSNHYN